MPADFVVDVDDSDDIVTARQAGRELARQLGFSLTDVTMIATATSEIARNITSYAGRGEVRSESSTSDGRQALVVREDDGPGSPTSSAHSRTPTRRPRARPRPARCAPPDGPADRGIGAGQGHGRGDVEMDSPPSARKGWIELDRVGGGAAARTRRGSAVTFRLPSRSVTRQRWRG